MFFNAYKFERKLPEPTGCPPDKTDTAYTSGDK
jgi:hypothetical protein